MSVTPAILTTDLHVSRDGVPILHGLSFRVETGSIYALLGGNGAGKSTTLLTLLGFLSASSGTVNVLGHDVGKDTAKVRDHVAFLPEAATLYPHLTAYENLDYFLDLAGLKTSRDDLDQALSRVALQAEARDQKMETYSKGMRQKVAIALAILRNAPVLLLDEPTSGLDPIAIDEFNALVRALAEEGRTILMVTHDVYGACQVADQIGLLRRGHMVGTFDAEPGARIDTETVHAAFADRAAA